MELREIKVSDDDIELSQVEWYSPAPDDNVFIIQKEKETDLSSTQMFNRAEARQLRDILDEYLSNLTAAGGTS